MGILPNLKQNDPIFVKKACKNCDDDRAFKNGYCVFNQRLGFAYSVDEIINELDNPIIEKWRKDAYILEKKLRDCAYDLDEKDEVIIKLKQENRDLKSKLNEYHFLERVTYGNKP